MALHPSPPARRPPLAFQSSMSCSLARLAILEGFSRSLRWLQRAMGVWKRPKRAYSHALRKSGSIRSRSCPSTTSLYLSSRSFIRFAPNSYSSSCCCSVMYSGLARSSGTPACERGREARGDWVVFNSSLKSNQGRTDDALTLGTTRPRCPCPIGWVTRPSPPSSRRQSRRAR